MPRYTRSACERRSANGVFVERLQQSNLSISETEAHHG
jgi:hypothetical protein